MNLPPDTSDNPTRIQKFIFILSLVVVYSLGIGLRVFDLTDEPIGYYPLRQLQGAVIARGIYYELRTDVDESLRQKAMAMEDSMVKQEPRIQQHIVAYIYLLVGEEIPWVASLYNTVLWVIGGITLFALSRRMAISNLKDTFDHSKAMTIGALSALLALTYYLILPFSVITSRSFQPDPAMVMLIILASYSIYRFSETNFWKWAFLSGLFSGLAILVKVMAFGPMIGVSIAMVGYIYAPRHLKGIPTAIKQMVLQPKLWLWMALMVGPTIVFYAGRSERVSEYTYGWMISLFELLLTPGLYLSWARVVTRLFHPFMLLASLAGLWFASGRNRALLVGLWMGYILYGMFFPYQIGTHDYYHLMLVPIVALSLTPTFQVIISRLLEMPIFLRIGFTAAVLLLVGFYSWQTIIFYARVDYREQPAVWQEIASHIPNDGKVIAITENFGMPLLYYGWRNVDIWPNINQMEVRELRGKNIAFEELFARQTKGKKYFLVTDFVEFDQQEELKQYLKGHYSILNEGDTWILYDLSKPQ